MEENSVLACYPKPYRRKCESRILEGKCLGNRPSSQSWQSPCLFWAAFASAQDEKNEVTGMIGRIFISDQGILIEPPPDNLVHSGKGLTFEVNYTRHLFATPIFGISGEVPAVFNLDEKLGSGV